MSPSAAIRVEDFKQVERFADPFTLKEDLGKRPLCARMVVGRDGRPP